MKPSTVRWLGAKGGPINQGRTPLLPPRSLSRWATPRTLLRRRSPATILLQPRRLPSRHHAQLFPLTFHVKTPLPRLPPPMLLPRRCTSRLAPEVPLLWMLRPPSVNPRLRPVKMHQRKSLAEGTTRLRMTPRPRSALSKQELSPSVLPPCGVTTPQRWSI